MDPVRQAIGAHLLADEDVTSLLSSPDAVYHQQAPRDAATPYVLFHRQTAQDRAGFGGSRGTTEPWLVKAIDRDETAEVAEDIAVALNRSLTDAELVIDGRAVQAIWRQTVVQYPEHDGAEIVHHVGGLYRVDVQPATT